jgi:SNF2 family DNA or RNA helicase
MGLGKTVSTLMALQNQIDNYDVCNTLIVGPLRVARKVWTDEIEIWEHIRDFEVQKIIGTEKQRLKAMRTPAEIHLINRENVSWLKEQMIQEKKWVRKWHWDNMIIDESSSFSYQSSQRWKDMRYLRKKVDRMVQLTGTPDTRSLQGLWAQIHLLDDGKRLGWSEKEFRRRWFIAPTRHEVHNNYIPRHYARDQIVNRLKDIVISMRAEDYIDVNRPHFNYVTVDMTKAELKVYKEMEREHILRFGDDIARAVNSGVLANKLLQICNGFVFTENPAFETLHNHKVDALLELLQGINGPVMINYNYIPDRIRIVAMLKKKKINFRVLKTEQDENDWNDGKIDVLLFHAKSAGHGCNIHKSGSNNLIFFGLLWSLEQYLQVIARLVGGHRAGDRENVIHIIITEKTYEDRVRYTLKRHGENQEHMRKALSVYARSIIG